MNFRQLRSFLAVAEHLHFTDAATHLGIAQPPPTQQVLKFERGIGTQLFVRYSHRVEFTEVDSSFANARGASSKMCSRSS
jgi:DNA-binding transcriptional LysR family regulator